LNIVIVSSDPAEVRQPTVRHSRSTFHVSRIWGCKGSKIHRMANNQRNNVC